MRRFFLLLIIILPSLLFSQESSISQYAVSGKIIDFGTKEPLEFATIIFRTRDSSEVLFGGIANDKGKFRVDVDKGVYVISVEFLSYQAKQITLNVTNRDFDVGTIELEIDTQFLAEVQVLGEKKALEIKPNKMVYNVSKDLSASGSNISDVLNNIPSVTIDIDGGISLRGQDATILINNRISSLSKSEALKSIPAASIEKIEIISNPGASFNASSLGIINIIMKKGKDVGLNSSLTLTGGYKDTYGGLLTLNHKSNKFNFYTNTSYFHRHPINQATNDNSYLFNGTPLGYLKENSENDNTGKGIYNTVGFEYSISKKTTLSASLNYQNITNDSQSSTVSDFFDNNSQIIKSNNRSHLGDFDNEVVELQLDLLQKFKKEGQELNVSFTAFSEIGFLCQIVFEL